MNENATSISITGKLSYSDEITISQAAQIIAYLNSNESEGAELGESLLDSSTTKKKSKTKKVDNPRDAIELSGATKNPEKIVALGAYVLQDGGETFKTEDVKTQFRRARETPPANFTRDLSVAIASGWVVEDGPGEYYLNNKFEGIFDEGFKFPKASGSARVRTVKKPGSKAKSGKPESLADVDEFSPTMTGFQPYSKMKTNKDRLLWALILMRDEHGRKSLTNKEIEYVTDVVGQGIPNAQITAAFVSAQSAGYAIRSTQDKTIRVTDEGATYLTELKTETVS
ncbi:MAG: hypothetical protein JWO18_654 [Microbacteriaceae bacterium]|nr:hypothetical protein [Microbacteriaceae bacterium]